MLEHEVDWGIGILNACMIGHEKCGMLG